MRVNTFHSRPVQKRHYTLSSTTLRAANKAQLSLIKPQVGDNLVLNYYHAMERALGSHTSDEMLQSYSFLMGHIVDVSLERATRNQKPHLNIGELLAYYAPELDGGGAAIVKKLVADMATQGWLIMETIIPNSKHPEHIHFMATEQFSRMVQLSTRSMRNQ